MFDLIGNSSKTGHLAGHFYFTKLLIPLLTVTAKNSPQGSVRVVNVSSLGHNVVPPEGIDWSTLAPGNLDEYLAAGKKLGALKLYGQSKLVKKSAFQCQQFLIFTVIGQYPLLERTCSETRRRRHCVHLLTSRNHQNRSRA